jgi:hypothetical protein
MNLAHHLMDLWNPAVNIYPVTKLWWKETCMTTTQRPMIGPDAFIPCLFMNITLVAWAFSDHFFVVLFSGLTDGVYSTREG